MSLREYLFVDSKRLEAYIEQVGSPVTYDKVPVWTTGLSLTGPKAEASQKRVARDLTQHEKIEKLLSYLREGGLVSSSRPSERVGDTVFVQEDCIATRVYVPPHPGVRGGTRGLNLWISPPSAPSQPTEDRRPGLLCLLEDFRGSDQKAAVELPVSAYTLLMSLVGALCVDARESLLAERLGLTSNEDGDGLVMSSRRQYDQHVASFVKDPVGTLEKLGCEPASRRPIHVLYRIREFGDEHESARDWSQGLTVSLFGYPIFITVDEF